VSAPQTPDVRFYHLTRTPLEPALATMLERTIARGQKAVVLASSEARVEHLCGWLWTYDDRGFLPHGSARDGAAEDQPIWVAVADERPNDADVLFLTDRADSARLDDYAVVALLFDAGDDEQLADARARWTKWKGDGRTPAYWKQTDQGWSQAG